MKHVVRRICWGMVFFFLFACTTFEEEPGRELTNRRQVSMGMSEQEVRQIMGDFVTVGQAVINDRGVTQPITVANPQRTQVITRRGRAYRMLFYLTHVRKSDGLITDDELTPFIFEDDRLIGQGWYFLNKISRQK